MVTTPSELNHALYSLRDLLARRREQGLEGIVLSPESLDQLAFLPTTLMKMSASAPASAAAPAAMTETGPSVEAETVIPLMASNPAPEATAAETPVIEHASPEYSSAARGIEILNPEGSTKREKLNNLYRMAKASEAARKLESLRDQLVFATGNPEAGLMIVGDAPDAEDEKQKKPFVGPAGQKLDGIVKAMGLSRDEIYISNIVKFRPMIGDGRFQGPKNRKPTPEEMAASVKYIMAEIEIVKPKAIIACGGTAAEGLLDLSGSVSRMRGQFYELNGIPVMVTYHPSYLLRAESDPDKGRPKKRMVWEDMLLVMEKMGLTISETQRSYFT